MQQYGPWQIRSSHEVYRDPWIAVRRDEVIRPDGADGTHVLVWMKPGVSVLALDDDGSVYLTDEFHYAIGRDSIELVSGGMEPGEDEKLHCSTPPWRCTPDSGGSPQPPQPSDGDSSTRPIKRSGRHRPSGTSGSRLRAGRRRAAARLS